MHARCDQCTHHGRFSAALICGESSHRGGFNFAWGEATSPGGGHAEGAPEEDHKSAEYLTQATPEDAICLDFSHICHTS